MNTKSPAKHERVNTGARLTQPTLTLAEVATLNKAVTRGIILTDDAWAKARIIYHKCIAIIVTWDTCCKVMAIPHSIRKETCIGATFSSDSAC